MTLFNLWRGYSINIDQFDFVINDNSRIFCHNIYNKKADPLFVMGNSACFALIGAKKRCLYSYSDWKSFIKSIEL